MKQKSFTIRPSTKTYQALEKLSSLRSTSKNKIVCEFLDSAVPHMESIIYALELAKDNNPESFSVMADVLKKTINESLEAQTDMIDSMVKNTPKNSEK